ncbi:MAG: GNAT family N-acetyltransferase [Planctomycetota bacterium]|nr:GNAT family N-acetyltransferase [Planctomycetota bacterium]MDA1252231.1 GNAT family N-acetyltransferase [Planctomycetota bacterium]
MLAVTELSSIDDLARIRMTWRRLWEQSLDASFFQSWDWLRSYLRIFGEGQKLRALVISDGATPVGIVPLLQQSVRTRLGVAGVLRYPAFAPGSTCGPIGVQTGQALARAIRHALRGRDCKAMELGRVDESGVDGGRTRTAMTDCRLNVQETERLEQPVVLLDESWDWCLAERNVDFRAQLESAERDLSQYGPISFFRWRPEGDLTGQTNRRWDLFEIFEQIRAANDEPTRQREAEMALLKDVHPAAVDAGAVEICLLSIAGRTIACSYGYHRRGTVDQLYVASVPQMDSAFPVLLARMIRDSFTRQDRRMLFQRPTDHVLDWCNGTVSTVMLGHFDRLSPQAQLLRKQLTKQQPV